MAGRRTLYAALQAAPPLLRPVLDPGLTFMNTANFTVEITTATLSSPTGDFIMPVYIKANSVTALPPVLTWNGVTIPKLTHYFPGGAVGSSGVAFYAMKGGAKGAQTLGATPAGSSLGRIGVQIIDVADWDFVTFDVITAAYDAVLGGSLSLPYGALPGQAQALLVSGAPEAQGGPFATNGAVELADFRQSSGSTGAAAVVAVHATTAAEAAGGSADFVLNAAVTHRVAYGIVLRNAPP